MAANQPIIMTIRFEQKEEGSNVIFGFGLKELVKKIPSGHGVVRASMILDDKGQLSEAELITEKL